MRLVTVEYLQAQNKPHIVLFTREGKSRQKTVINDFQPYFYIPIGEHPNKVKNLPFETFKDLFGTPVAKYYTKLPGDVTHLRRMFSKTWEADVHFTTRFLIDRIPEIKKVNLRVQYTDIEEDQETNQIISIAVFDDYLNKVVCFVWKSGLKPEIRQETFTFPSGYRFHASVRLYNSKTTMLSDYIRFVRNTDPDILTGWYFLGYDMPEIVKEINETKNLSAAWLSPLGRCYINKEKKYYQDEVTCKGRVLWDMLKAYRKLQPTGLPDASLEAISQKELGEGKKTFEHTISWLWKKNLKTLVEYNCKDAVLVYRLDKKCKILDYYDSFRRWLGCEWGNLYSAVQKWDVKILRKAFGKVVLPTKKYIDIPRVKGAEVFRPASKGIHPWVVVLDLKSLYPSIIMTYNMSPETVVKGESNEEDYNLKNGVSFRSEPIGLLPSILKELLEERKKYKDEMLKYPFGTSEYDVYDHLQTGVKVMMNALYGSTLYSNFRLAAREVGRSITFIGRKIINWVRQRLEQLGFKVLYGDTDSVFYYSKKVNVKEIVEEMNELINTLNTGLKDFIGSNGGDSLNSYIRIEPKKVYSKFLIALRKGKSGEPAKKRYAGRLVWNEGKEEDTLDVMGFEARRSNSSELSRELQKEILRVLFDFEPMEELKVYIEEAKNNIERLLPDWDYIAIPQGLSKPLHKYKTDNPWRRGAKWSNEYLGTNFGKGDKPKLIYVKSVPDGYAKTDVVCFRSGRDLPKGFVVDTEKMFQKSVVMKVEQVLDAANLSFEEIFYGQTKLSQF